MWATHPMTSSSRSYRVGLEPMSRRVWLPEEVGGWQVLYTVCVALNECVSVYVRTYVCASAGSSCHTLQVVS